MFDQRGQNSTHGGGNQRDYADKRQNPPANFKLELYEGNDKSRIKFDLFDKQAEEAAKEIVKEGKKKINKMNQIRIFYSQFIVLNEKVNSLEDNFRKQLPYIKMIKSRAKYSKGRKNIGDYFENFLIQCVDEINTLEDFKLVCNFFESVVGFATYYDKEEIGVN